MTSPTDVSIESRYTPLTSPGRATGLEPSFETRWHPATLIAFRFGFVYFGAFVVISMLPMILIIPGSGGNFELDLFGPYRRIVEWIGVHAFGIAIPFSSAQQAAGSGDTIFDWVNVLTLLVIAALATVIWSAVARERAKYARLYAAFRVLLRFALGATMVHYGTIKLVLHQMSPPGLARLLEPFGDFSPMSVLWSSIGASAAYEMIAGAAEVAGGLLVMIPQTAKIGALICLIDTTNVVVLNMTYDVPVKLFAFHLLAMSLVLVAPDARRFVNIFLRGRADCLTPEPTLGGSPRSRRVAINLQVIYVAYFVAWWLYVGPRLWRQDGGGAPESPLYGIWEVQRMTIDGAERAPLLTDSTRWRRVLFDAPDDMQIQRMPDVATSFVATIDTIAHTIVLRPSVLNGSAATSVGGTLKPDSSKSQPMLAYRRPDRARLVLDGTVEGRAMHVELAYRDPSKFTLRSRGFHWVQAQPFLP